MMTDLRTRWAETQALREQTEAQIEAMEAEVVADAMLAADGRVMRAAALLDVPRQTLDTLLRRGHLRHLRDMATRKMGRPPGTPKVP